MVSTVTPATMPQAENAGFLSGTDDQKSTLKKGANTLNFDVRLPK
jgi:hypothetical protein